MFYAHNPVMGPQDTERQIQGAQGAIEAYNRIAEAAAGFFAEAFPRVNAETRAELVCSVRDFYTAPIIRHIELLRSPAADYRTSPEYMSQLIKDHEQVKGEIDRAETALAAFDEMPKAMGDSMRAYVEIALLRPIRERFQSIEEEISERMKAGDPQH